MKTLLGWKHKNYLESLRHFKRKEELGFVAPNIEFTLKPRGLIQIGTGGRVLFPKGPTSVPMKSQAALRGGNKGEWAEGPSGVCGHHSGLWELHPEGLPPPVGVGAPRPGAKAISDQGVTADLPDPVLLACVPSSRFPFFCPAMFWLSDRSNFKYCEPDPQIHMLVLYGGGGLWETTGWDEVTRGHTMPSHHATPITIFWCSMKALTRCQHHDLELVSQQSCKPSKWIDLY